MQKRETAQNRLTKKERGDIMNKLTREGSEASGERAGRGEKKLEKSLKNHLTKAKSCDIIRNADEKRRRGNEKASEKTF